MAIVSFAVLKGGNFCVRVSRRFSPRRMGVRAGTDLGREGGRALVGRSSSWEFRAQRIGNVLGAQQRMCVWDCLGCSPYLIDPTARIYNFPHT